LCITAFWPTRLLQWVTACSRRGLAALDLRCLPAARFHRPAARRCTGLTSGLGTNAIDVTNGHPLITPSLDAQDHARGSERYHTSEGIERGLDRVRARARTAPILLPLGPRWVQKTRQGITRTDGSQSVCLGYRRGWAFNESQRFRWLHHFGGQSKDRGCSRSDCFRLIFT
jgi:hypothetical protein